MVGSQVLKKKIGKATPGASPQDVIETLDTPGAAGEVDPAAAAAATTVKMAPATQSV